MNRVLSKTEGYRFVRAIEAGRAQWRRTEHSTEIVKQLLKMHGFTEDESFDWAMDLVLDADSSSFIQGKLEEMGFKFK